MTGNALIRRLSFYADLGRADEKEIAELASERAEFERDTEIISAGGPMDRVLIVNEGWAMRYKLLNDGRRQVLNFLLPGDIFDLQVLVAAEADHSILSITELSCLAVQPRDFRKLLTASGTLTMAFWWTQVQEEAFLREQIVRNGRQNARERVGHLLLELHRRMQIVKGGTADRLRMPLTQAIIADALGLSTIHTNRILKQLEREGLIVKKRGALTFADWRKLAASCQFDPGYFHIDDFQYRLGRLDA